MHKEKHCSMQSPGTEALKVAMLLSHWLSTQCAVLSVAFWPLYVLFLLPRTLSPSHHTLTTQYPIFLLPFLWLTPTASSLDAVTPEKLSLTFFLLSWVRGPSCVLPLGATWLPGSLRSQTARVHILGLRLTGFET